MKEYLTWFIIGLYVYGWLLIFFDKSYYDGEGNPITKKQWKQMQKQNYIYH